MHHFIINLIDDNAKRCKCELQHVFSGIGERAAAARIGNNNLCCCTPLLPLSRSGKSFCETLD